MRSDDIYEALAAGCLFALVVMIALLAGAWILGS